MTKEPDFEGAWVAASIVMQATSPPFRYIVTRAEESTPIALTLTKWSATILTSALKKADGYSYIVRDLEGNPWP